MGAGHWLGACMTAAYDAAKIVYAKTYLMADFPVPITAPFILRKVVITEELEDPKYGSAAKRNLYNAYSDACGREHEDRHKKSTEWINRGLGEKNDDLNLRMATAIAKSVVNVRLKFKKEKLQPGQAPLNVRFST